MRYFYIKRGMRMRARVSVCVCVCVCVYVCVHVCDKLLALEYLCLLKKGTRNALSLNLHI